MLGHHSLIILDARVKDDFNAICCKINDSISSGYAVLYAIEGNTIAVLKKMKRIGIIEDIEDHIQNGDLNLMDTATIYADAIDRSGQVSVSTELLKKWKNMINRIKQHGTRKGILVIAGGNLVFAKMKDFEQLMFYERGMKQTLRHRRRLEIICYYSEDTVDKIPIRYFIPIIKSHSHLMDRDFVKAKLDDYRVLHYAEKGIDDVLGENSGKLFFRTLKLIYGIDQDRIIQHPELLEEKLQKMFGRSSDRILQSIMDKLKNMMHDEF